MAIEHFDADLWAARMAKVLDPLLRCPNCGWPEPDEIIDRGVRYLTEKPDESSR